MAINSTIELPELTEEGNRLLEGNKQNLVYQDPGGRSSDPVSVQESAVEAWVGGDLLQGWGH